MSSDPSPDHLNRRAVLKRLAGAAATVPALALAQKPGPPGAPGLDPAAVRPATPSDPDLNSKKPWWPMLLTPAEMTTITVLADIILPADETSPAASAAGVPEFINEWVSAPYPIQEADRAIIRGGLGWLNTESDRRKQLPFHQLPAVDQTALCDDICHPATAKPEHVAGARFFSKFRDLCASGYYTTPEGMKDIGYVGNVPSPEFKGPTPEVLAHLAPAFARAAR